MKSKPQLTGACFVSDRAEVAGVQRELAIACTHSSLSLLSQVAMGAADMVTC